MSIRVRWSSEHFPLFSSSTIRAQLNGASNCVNSLKPRLTVTKRTFKTRKPTSVRNALQLLEVTAVTQLARMQTCTQRHKSLAAEIALSVSSGVPSFTGS